MKECSSLLALLEKGSRSRRFETLCNEQSYAEDASLSERLLFTQSNGRVLLAQDSMGRMTFVSAPHETDYPLPTGCIRSEQLIKGYDGMFYQTDLALFFPKMRYVIESDDGGRTECYNNHSKTCYLDDFLPLTETSSAGLSMKLLSFAPVLEPGAPSPFSFLPLPGPSGMFYTLVLTNTSGNPFSGKVTLKFEDDFIIRSESNLKDPVERDVVKPYHREFERDLFTYWRPDACASFHLLSGRHNADAEHPEYEMTFKLKPGETTEFSTAIAVSPEKKGIAPALSALYRHTPLEWLTITKRFWKERLGRLTLGIGKDDALSETVRDFHTRSIIDNFNCLQFDETGRLLVHWQGAPSHNMGRFWGIDIEPTGLSLLYAMPELAKSLLDYLMSRNRPFYSSYQNHSVAILVSLLILAAKYYELTGDTEYFRRDRPLLDAMAETAEKVLSCRHKKKYLFASRYSSDGPVFHKYDLGTNAKVYFAFAGYSKLLHALGDPAASRFEALLPLIRRDLSETLAGEGPFGPQYTGGANLGEQDGFYFRDSLWYYDGEDSSSCMAPLYGLCCFDNPLWQNYHRFARSLFATNYDPETEAIRWYFYGGSLDGTAYVSKLGGSVTRNEMKDAFQNMIDRSVDITGSLFWWPKGINKKRCVARCSQGQGSFVFQLTEQWLGLHMDAPARTLTISPKGLPDRFSWKNARLGSALFDIDYAEQNGIATLSVTNRNAFEVRLLVGIRPDGAGCDGFSDRYEAVVKAHESFEAAYPMPAVQTVSDAPVHAVEVSRFEKNGIVFGPFGLHLPGADDQNGFLLRFVLIGGKAAPLSDVTLTLKVPEGWGVSAKEPCIWTVPNGADETAAAMSYKTVGQYESVTFPFFVFFPKRSESSAGQGFAEHAEAPDRGAVWLSRHPFEVPPYHPDEPLSLFVSAAETYETAFEYTLSFADHDGNPVIISETLPVHGLGAEAFTRMVKKFVYGEE